MLAQKMNGPDQTFDSLLLYPDSSILDFKAQGSSQLMKKRPSITIKDKEEKTCHISLETFRKMILSFPYSA